MQRIKIILLTIFNVSILTNCVLSQGSDKDIYMVVIPKTSNHRAAIQSGFRLRGTKGIITCLHGVLDGEVFSAFNEAGDHLNGLIIKYVDIKNDLALLQSDELVNRDADGLAEATESPVSGKRLSVIGHPDGISLNKKTVYVGSPAINKLAELIPPNSAREFNIRNSPSPSIDVIYLEGSLIPGHSGAALVDDNNRVYGVVDGGIRQGAAGISWAIPLTNVRWQRPALYAATIDDINKTDPSSLFYFQDYDASDDNAIVIADDGTGNFRSFGDAFANSGTNISIILKPGRYYDVLHITTGFVSIKGRGNKDDIVIKGIFVEKDANVEISNVTVENSIYNSGKLKLSDAVIGGDNVGLKSYKGSAVVRNCDFTTQKNNTQNELFSSVWVTDGDVYMENCTFHDTDYGVLTDENCHVEFKGCLFKNNWNAIGLGDGHETITERNCTYDGNHYKYQKNPNSTGTINGVSP
jgi:S1-C subfamily serine protease